MFTIEQHRARGLVEGKWSRRPLKAICGLVVHTTGAGPWRRWNDGTAFDSPFDAAVHTFTKIVTTGAHYVVCGDTGRVAQLTPHAYAAWHVGSKGSWQYRLPAWHKLSNVRGWRDRWPDLKSPRDFLDGRCWAKGSVNALTIGVEVAPPRSGPRNEWSTHTWASLAELVQGIAELYHFPVDDKHVLTHSDVHPLKRSTKSGNLWDPGAIQWPNPATALAKLKP